MQQAHDEQACSRFVIHAGKGHDKESDFDRLRHDCVCCQRRRSFRAARPTELEFAPGFPYDGSPFDIPFEVKNKSGFFAIQNLTILCGLKKVTTTKGASFSDFSVTTSGDNYLREMGAKELYMPLQFDLSVFE
jgi:hypothetical protein